MSAFIVSSDHIDYIVQAAIAAGYNGSSYVRWPEGEPGEWIPATYETADHIGAALWAENAASVAFRYAHRDDVEMPDGYEFTPYQVGMIQPVQVCKALDCYEYQSCEHPGWEESTAHRFCQLLRRRMIARMPEYDDALWEITRHKLREQLREWQAEQAHPEPAGMPSSWTLYRLADGSGVVVAFDANGRVIDGQAGFEAGDVDHALHLVTTTEDGAHLRDWQFLTLTPEAASYVAATFPAVCNE